MQDGAPGHTAKIVQAWLKTNLNFWPKDVWPPSSPDLNPLDYSIWAFVQSRACKSSHPNLEALKSSISSASAAGSGHVSRLSLRLKAATFNFYKLQSIVFQENIHFFPYRLCFFFKCNKTILSCSCVNFCHAYGSYKKVLNIILFNIKRSVGGASVVGLRWLCRVALDFFLY